MRPHQHCTTPLIVVLHPSIAKYGQRNAQLLLHFTVMLYLSDEIQVTYMYTIINIRTKSSHDWFKAVSFHDFLSVSADSTTGRMHVNLTVR